MGQLEPSTHPRRGVLEPHPTGTDVDGHDVSYRLAPTSPNLISNTTISAVINASTIIGTNVVGILPTDVMSVS